MTKNRSWWLALCLCCLGFGLGAQTGGGPSQLSLNNLRQAIGLFADGSYEAALPMFDALARDPSAGALRAEGAYWLAMTYIAQANFPIAIQKIDSFLSAYPGHERRAELQYQQGRMLFLQQDYARALVVLQAFLSANPQSDLYSAGLFWAAECLYESGRLAEAERLYRTIDEVYPESVKAEASRYRLELIRFKYREDELLTLLRWSHEESLKVIEEFQRRETSYEQALQLYQKRYGDLQRSMPESQSALETELLSLRSLVSRLEDELASSQRQVISLQARLDSQSTQDGQALVQEYKDKLELLRLKEETLDLMEAYLLQLNQAGGQP